MKLLIFFLNILFPVLLQSQCVTGNVHIYNDDKLGEYIQNYGKCDTVTGDLVIGPEVAGGQTRLIDIKGLENIRVVLGNLEVRSNQWLEDISSLQNIEFVGGQFLYQDNPKIKKNVTFKVKEVTGSVQVFPGQFSNATVSFPLLKTIGGDLLISGFKQSGSVFPALKSIQGSLRYYSYAAYCNEFNQLENVKTVTLGFRHSGVEVIMFQKLRKAESFDLDAEFIRQIALSPNIEVDYLTLNAKINHPLLTFSQNRKYKSFTIYNILSTKDYKKMFGPIDSVGYLLLGSTTDLDTFDFHPIKSAEVVMLYGAAIKALPRISSIREQLQIRGKILDGYLDKYLIRNDFIPTISINGIVSTRLAGAPRVSCDVFSIQHNSHLKDLKDFEFKYINTGLIEIEDNKIDSISFDVSGIDLNKTQMAIHNNANLSYCPREWACKIFEHQTLFEKKKYNFIFSGNRTNCNDVFLKNECDK